FRHRRTKETITLELSEGLWLVMAGKTQRFWVHQVPKTTTAVERRINLTFAHDRAAVTNDVRGPRGSVYPPLPCTATHLGTQELSVWPGSTGAHVNASTQRHAL